MLPRCIADPDVVHNGIHRSAVPQDVSARRLAKNTRSLPTAGKHSVSCERKTPTSMSPCRRVCPPRIISTEYPPPRTLSVKSPNCFGNSETDSGFQEVGGSIVSKIIGSDPHQTPPQSYLKTNPLELRFRREKIDAIFPANMKRIITATIFGLILAAFAIAEPPPTSAPPTVAEIRLSADPQKALEARAGKEVKSRPRNPAGSKSSPA
jgi:hypothetical protein